MVSPERMSWVLVTPNFRASSHIIFFILYEGVSDPVFVVKIARIQGDDLSLRHEADNLTALHASRGGGFSSAPRMIALTTVGGNSMLVESALAGTHMDPACIQGRLKWSIEAVLRWLMDLHTSTSISNSAVPDWYARLVEEPIARLESALEPSKDEEDMLGTVRGMAEALRDVTFPLVFSHGDLSHPNILVLRKGGVGVVDWEMAEQSSIPAADLFFFLTFVASARHPWVAEDVSAFRKAFFSRGSWTQQYLSRYSEALGLSEALLNPLFVLCFTRYLSGLVARLKGPAGNLDRETLASLRTDRAYILWRETIEHADELRLN